MSIQVDDAHIKPPSPSPTTWPGGTPFLESGPLAHITFENFVLSKDKLNAYRD